MHLTDSHFSVYFLLDFWSHRPLRYNLPHRHFLHRLSCSFVYSGVSVAALNPDGIEIDLLSVVTYEQLCPDHILQQLQGTSTDQPPFPSSGSFFSTGILHVHCIEKVMNLNLEVRALPLFHVSVWFWFVFVSVLLSTHPQIRGSSCFLVSVASESSFTPFIYLLLVNNSFY